MNDLQQTIPGLHCCSSNGGSDLVPLLVVAAVFIGLHIVGRWLKKKGIHPMKNWKQVVLVAVLAVAVVAVFALKKKETQPVPATMEPTPAAEVAEQPASLPRLIDLGADKCIPCRMMAPIVEELKKEYAGVFKTEFIDVWQNQAPAREYGIRVIPTQIFFDAEGKELFRHEGYFSKEDILNTWEKHGVDISREAGNG